MTFNKTTTSIDGSLYQLSFMLGVLTITRVGDLELWRLVSIPVFKRAGRESTLFGVNWNV